MALAPHGSRVLVVDDDASIRMTVRDILAAEGHEVSAARDGVEAIALVRTWSPSIVLLDWRMPGIDGWGVARAMRELAPNVPIVIMTAAENAARTAEEISADAYLAKPFEPDDLLECVARLGARSRASGN